MRKAAQTLAGKAAVVQINTDTSPRLSGRFGVSGIPVLHLLKRGQSVDRLTGAQPAESIVSWFMRHSTSR